MKHLFSRGAFLTVAFVGLVQLGGVGKELALESMPPGFKEFDLMNAAPECVSWKRYMPKFRDPKAYRIYTGARKIWRGKIEWQLTHDEAMEILSGVRAAADMGDWGARALMAKFYLQGLGVLDTNRVLQPDPMKAISILRTAASVGQPWAIYDLGVAHQYGYGGVRQSDKLAWAYFLKAATLGSPEAQMALASAYSDARQFQDEKSMLLCAYRQRHSEAAHALGVHHVAITEHFAQAIRYFQDGTEYGNRDSAVALEQLYADGYWSYLGEQYKPAFERLGVEPDVERSRRYEEIAAALDINPDLKLTRLNEVLPLPPTTLPPWRGVASALEPETDDPPSY